MPWAEGYRNEAAIMPRYQLHRMDVTFGRYQLAVAPQAALETLERLHQRAAAEGWGESSVEINILLALAYHAINNVDGAAIALSRALSLAAPERYLSTVSHRRRKNSTTATPGRHPAAPSFICGVNCKLRSSPPVRHRPNLCPSH